MAVRMDQNTVLPVLSGKDLRLFHQIGSHISCTVRDQKYTLCIIRIDFLFNSLRQFTDADILSCRQIPDDLSLLRQWLHHTFVYLIIHNDLRKVTCSQLF